MRTTLIQGEGKMKNYARVLILTAAICLLTGGMVYAELTVSRATFCEDIEEREPVNSAESFPATIEQVYCFAEIQGAEPNTTVKHIWYYEGEKVAEIDMVINGPRWRTYSYKTITPDMKGKWGVEITDSESRVLKPLSMEIE